MFVYSGAVDAYFFDDDFQWLVGSWAFHHWNLVDITRLTHFYRPVTPAQGTGPSPGGGAPGADVAVAPG